MSMQLWIEMIGNKLKQRWLKQSEESKENLSSLANHKPTSLEQDLSQERAKGNPSLIKWPSQALQALQSPNQSPSHPLVDLDSLLSPSTKVDRLYWMCFMDYKGEFIGVIIGMGSSPGSAANIAINAGLVESERANIIELDPTYERVLHPYMDRLL